MTTPLFKLSVSNLCRNPLACKVVLCKPLNSNEIFICFQRCVIVITRSGDIGKGNSKVCLQAWLGRPCPIARRWTWDATCGRFAKFCKAASTPQRRPHPASPQYSRAGRKISRGGFCRTGRRQRHDVRFQEHLGSSIELLPLEGQFEVSSQVVDFSSWNLGDEDDRRAAGR